MTHAPSDPFITDGEIGQRIRDLDWSRTPLGPLSTWPHDLIIAINLVLENPFPQILLWGRELAVCAYNDSYRPLLGDKPEALGRGFLEVWAEARDIIDAPLRAALDGKRCRFQNMPFVLYRHGQWQQSYFDFSFSPVRLASGAVGGVLNTGLENTATVHAAMHHEFHARLDRALRPLRDPVQILMAASAVIGEYLEAGQVAYADIDATGEYATIQRDWNDGSLPSNVGHHRLTDFGGAFIHDLKHGQTIVIDDIRLDPRTAPAADAFARIRVGAFLNVPLIKAGGLSAILTIHHREPRHWWPAEVALAEEAAESTWAALERARAEHQLQEADRRKDEFLATLAHELRNPLAPLQSGIEILRLEPGNRETGERVLAMMERQMGNLKHLVDDLLDVSRIARGKIDLHTESLDLGALVHDCVEPLLGQGGHGLSVDLPPTPLMVAGDRMRLRQVMGNLLNNAVKYSPGGGRIWVRVHQDRDRIRLSIRDEGIGIAPEMRERIFDTFTQLDASADGLGIGLSLVQQLVRLHGGEVAVRSDGPGRGSEFVVSLPRHQPHGAHPAEGRDAPGLALQGHRILVVDDNRDAATSLAMLLEVMGAAAHTAHDGPSALALLERFDPQMVLLDIGMPGMDGHAVAAAIRERRPRNTPLLVAVTGRGQEPDRDRSHAAGFDEHLTKPVDLNALRDIAARLGDTGTTAD